MQPFSGIKSIYSLRRVPFLQSNSKSAVSREQKKAIKRNETKRKRRQKSKANSILYAIWFSVNRKYLISCGLFIFGGRQRQRHDGPVWKKDEKMAARMDIIITKKQYFRLSSRMEIKF